MASSRFIAFGERHPGNARTRNVYERAAIASGAVAFLRG
jgi:hypothetical protein